MLRRTPSFVGSLTLLALICAHTALADGMERPGGKGFVPLTYNWSGVYFGVNAGYGWGESDVTENPIQLLGIIPSSFGSSNDVNGFIGGVHLGLNKQFDHWVLGGEFRLDGANIDGSTGDCAGLTSVVGVPGLVRFDCSSKVNWVAAALARLGYAQDRWLAYGTLGWAVAGVSYNASINVPIIGLSLPSGQNDTADGFAFGGGVEYALSDSLTLGVDYTRMNLKDDGGGLLLGGILTSGNREIDLNTVTARLNLKWGARPARLGFSSNSKPAAQVAGFLASRALRVELANLSGATFGVVQIGK